MSLLRRRRRKSKRNPNPYASRGLDKFALLAAELAEKRQQLSLQLGAPVSVVRFTLGSHSKWIPIIVSPTKKKAVEIKSPSLMISDRSVSTVQDFTIIAAAAPSPTNSAAIQQQNATNGRDRSLSSARNEGEAWLEMIAQITSIVGTVAGIVWAAKVSITVGMTIATALASSVLLRRWHAETAMAIDRNLSETPAAEEGTAGSSSASAAAAVLSSSNRPTEISLSIADRSSTASSSLPIAESKLLMPAPVRISKAPSKESSPRSSEAASLVSSPTTQRSRLKCKFLREGLQKKPETLSAPSTPSPSRKCNAHIAASSSEAALFHNDKSSPSRELARWSSLVRERQRKEKAARVGTSLTAAGLVIVLGGLLLGKFTAMVGVICWWYTLPSLRNAVGDKPFVRSHNHSSSIDKHQSNSIAITATNTSSKKTISGVGNGNFDLQAREHKKKVVLPIRSRQD